MGARAAEMGEVPLGSAGYWLVGNWVQGCLLTWCLRLSRVGGGQAEIPLGIGRALMAGNDVRVAVDLPLPLDMAATITKLLGLAYPGAMIDFGAGRGGQLVIRVPDGDRRRPQKVGKRAAAAARDEAVDDSEEGSLAGFDDDGTVRIIPPEDLAKSIAVSLAVFLDDHPEAANYMEWTVHDPSDGHAYVIYACRSPQQTPHALRRQAETERDDALIRLAEASA